MQRISKTTSCNALYGINTQGVSHADIATGKTLWLCYVVQAVEYRPNPVATPSRPQDSTAYWNLSFGSRI